MKIRSKLLAVLGASVLTVGVVGAAFAVELKDVHQNTTITWDENGNPSADNGFSVNTDSSCEGANLGDGEVLVHFVQSPTEANSGNITVDAGTDGSVGPQADDGQSNDNSSQLGWSVLLTDDGDGSLTIVDATTDVDGGELKISHICAGTEVKATETPEFSASQQGETDVPTEPNTASLGTTGTSGPADGAWMLVVALGVLLASVVVLTPARAKSRR